MGVGLLEDSKEFGSATLGPCEWLVFSRVRPLLLLPEEDEEKIPESHNMKPTSPRRRQEPIPADKKISFLFGGAMLF